MGTGPFAVPMFRALVESTDHQTLGLITRPSRQGKSRQAVVNPMREAAEQLGVEVRSPEDINSDEGQQLLRDWAPDVLVVCDYGQILSAPMLGLARRGGVNLHGSLLPKYRGAAPVQWALLNGDEETGVTVIHMTPRMDAGPILAARRVTIDPDETHEQLEPRLAKAGVEPVLESLARLEQWDGESPLGAVQDKALACRAPRLSKADGRVNWSATAAAIKNQVRALKPWPGAFTFVPRRKGDPQRLKIDRVRVVTADELAAAGVEAEGAAGEVVVSDKDRLWIRTGDGAVALEAVQPAGKRLMTASEYLRGFQPEPGLKLES